MASRAEARPVRSDSNTLKADPTAEQANNFALGSLGEASAFHDDISLSGDADKLLHALRTMILIRAAEERIGDMVECGNIKCPCHLAIGQEAAAAGVALNLSRTDRAFGAHRSHSHYLASGGSLRALFAEVLGKNTGASGGMGGSMHLLSLENGFYGSVPIVAATIPIAVGAALAAKMDNGDDIAVSYFGDGATEEGAFHESMNLAAILNVPVLFVCENNMFSSHLHIKLRQPADSLVRYAAAHCVSFARVDGNDVVEVARVSAAAIAEMRKERKPFFLECVTYRWRGHVGHREDEDVGVQRSDDLAIWKKRDPIARLTRSLEMAGILSEKELADVRSSVREEVAAAWQQAADDPFPAKTALLERTWTHPPGVRT